LPRTVVFQAFSIFPFPVAKNFSFPGIQFFSLFQLEAVSKGWSKTEKGYLKRWPFSVVIIILSYGNTIA